MKNIESICEFMLAKGMIKAVLGACEQGKHLSFHSASPEDERKTLFGGDLEEINKKLKGKKVAESFKGIFDDENTTSESKFDAKSNNTGFFKYIKEDGDEPRVFSLYYYATGFLGVKLDD